MASIIEGYNYDIFISYRQKDNRHDGWVTEFVNNLKDELESTFKEEISVYFDINLHDGLLETYDIDASLKEKLKCLIFIPIISRTYCDPKSFAWEHEFKSFVELASKDRFGLKITLSNGNVMSRVLPVKIHDLDTRDIKTCESLLGGVLRGIEFIYKEAGVNRPLIPKEDHPDKNLNKTIYRNQINKVANSISEIINGLNLDCREVKQEEYVYDKKSRHFHWKTALIPVLFMVIISAAAILFIVRFRSSKPLTRNLIALNYYERGKEEYRKYMRTGNRAQLNLAEISFRKAKQNDSHFAESYVGLASVEYLKSRFKNVTKADYLDSMMILCNQALSINRRLPEAYAQLGFYYFELNEPEKSKEQFDMALKLDHKNGLTYYGLGISHADKDPLISLRNFEMAESLDDGSYHSRIQLNMASLFSLTGFPELATDIFKHLYAIDKDYVNFLNLHSANEYYSGNYAASLDYARKAHQKDSSNHELSAWLGYSYFLNRDFANALKNYERIISDSIIGDFNDLFSFCRIAFCYDKVGLNEKRDFFIKKSIDGLNNLKNVDRYTGMSRRYYYDLACAYSVLGDKEKELQNIIFFTDQPFISSEFLNLMKNDPCLDNLKENEEYRKLLTKLENNYQNEHEKVRVWLESKSKKSKNKSTH